MRQTITALLWISIIFTNYAQNDAENMATKTQELNAILEQMHKKQQFNGTVLIAEEGKVVYEKTIGIANSGTKEPLKPNSSYRLASVSKQFIGMGIMILKEKGKLDYEDDIRKHIPELPYQGITIRNLLNHTGGLPDYMGLFEMHWDTTKAQKDRKMAYNKDMVKLFATHQPEIVFEPNAKFEYSNTGYVLLGEIIERASGQSIHDFLYKEIFQPAGMVNTRAYKYPGDFGISDRVYGFNYTPDGTTMEENDFTPINGMVGDGGIYATATDLLAWSNVLNTEKLVKQTTLQEAYQSVKLGNGEMSNYGFGWSLTFDDAGELTAVSHSGGWVGFRTFIHRDLEAKRTAIFLTNHASQYLGQLVQLTKKVWAGDEYQLPKMPISKIIAEAIEKEGNSSLLEVYNLSKLGHADEVALEEYHLNQLGYYYLSKDRIEDAISVFLLNVMAFPESDNVYDSAGEAYLKKGDKEKAKIYYSKAYQMNLGNDNAKKILIDLGVDTDQFVKEEKLGAEALKEYRGVYEIVPAFKITITTREDRIFAQATGQGEAEIFPEGPDKFALKIVDAQLSFNRNDEGMIESLTLHQNGMDQKARKVE